MNNNINIVLEIFKFFIYDLCFIFIITSIILFISFTMNKINEKKRKDKKESKKMKIGDRVRIFGSEKVGIITEIIWDNKEDTNQNPELKVHYEGFDIIIKSEGIEYLNGVLYPLINDDSTQYHNSTINDLPESFYKPWAAIGNKPDLNKLNSDNHKDTK